MGVLFGLFVLGAVAAALVLGRDRVLPPSAGALTYDRWRASNATDTKRVEGVLVTVERRGTRISASAPYVAGDGPSFAISTPFFDGRPQYIDVDAQLAAIGSNHEVGGDRTMVPVVAAVLRRHARRPALAIDVAARDGLVNVMIVPSGTPDVASVDWLVQITASIASHARALLDELAIPLRANVEIRADGRAHLVAPRRVPIDIVLSRAPDGAFGLELNGKATAELDTEVTERITTHLETRLDAQVALAPPCVTVWVRGLPSAERLREVLDAVEQILAPETNAPFR